MTGHQGDNDRPFDRPGPGQRLGALEIAVALAVALALGLLAARFLGRPGSPAPTSDPAGDEATAAGPRLVVLPFEHQGPAEHAYFADGLTEEITSRLTAVAGVGVISRTSAVQAAEGDGTAAELARRLGADHALVGTVRWLDADAGDEPARVRITPELVRAADAGRLWSETYERRLGDIFEVQSEIAGRVVDALGVQLVPAERAALAERPTDDLEAYRLYLRALEYQRRPGDPAFQEEAIDRLRRATELDPGFALAWAHLSMAHAQLHHFGHDRSEPRRRLAAEALARARELAPDDPEVHRARAYYFYWTLKDYDAALAELAIAERQLPNAFRVLEAQGYILRRRGDLEGALAKLRRAFALSPLDGRMAREIGSTLAFLRRHDEADAFYDRAIELLPDPTIARLSKARNAWLAGDLAAARAVLDATPPSDDPLEVWFRVWQDVYERRYDAALERLRASGVGSLQWTIRALPMVLLEARILDLEGNEPAARSAYGAALAILDQELEVAPLDARLHGSRGLALAGLGRAEEAVAAGRRSVELLPRSKDAIFGAYRRVELAMIHTRLGQLDAALAELEDLVAMPSQVTVERLELDPVWDPLRQHPRYRELIQRPSESSASP